jgi:hypothetical protein
MGLSRVGLQMEFLGRLLQRRCRNYYNRSEGSHFDGASIRVGRELAWNYIVLERLRQIEDECCSGVQMRGEVVACLDLEGCYSLSEVRGSDRLGKLVRACRLLGVQMMTRWFLELTVTMEDVDDVVDDVDLHWYCWEECENTAIRDATSAVHSFSIADCAICLHKSR